MRTGDIHRRYRRFLACSGVRQRGLTYLALLFLVAIAGVLLAAQGSLFATARKREREQELLFIGHQFRNAIGSYYNNSPGAVKAYPNTLEDMLEDKRFPSTRRELRRIYADPFSGKKDWGLVHQASNSGGIIAVYSLSTDVPVKRHGFRPEDVDFDDKQSYSKWIFTYSPNATGPAVPAGPIGGNGVAPGNGNYGVPAATK